MEIRTVQKTDAIRLNKSISLTIGSSFKSDIYYQYHNLIKDTEAVIFNDGTGYYLKRGKDTVLLEYGDIHYIKRLFIMFLNRYLLIFAFDGDYRIAKRGEYAAY